MEGPAEGLYFLNERGRLIPINPASRGIIGNSPDLADALKGAAYTHVRGVIDAYTNLEDKLAQDGVNSIQDNRP
jgi:hypothetical protein